jgi:two-component system, NtrC family, nitrogen regulation sensor histidine kinase NtrY
MKRQLAFESRLALMGLLAGLPAVVVAIIFLWVGDVSPRTRWTLILLIGGCWFGFTLALRERIARPLQTMANIVSALREEDFSIRAHGARRSDSLGELGREVNVLSKTLREQRLGALEATALLRKVMEEIDVAVFAFDEAQCLRLVNRASERLLARSAEHLLGLTAGELGLADCLSGEPARTVEMQFPGAPGRWGLRRSTFRQRGRPHQLIVLADLSRPLREEERQAWQRLIRVLGHELNNSLAPIKSIAASLDQLLRREPRPPDWEEDLRGGLSVISSRTEALTRFLSAYSRLARLPAPRFASVDVGLLIRRVAGLEPRLAVAVRPGRDLVIRADGDQLEQLLINLIHNAADAVLESSGGVPPAEAAVSLGWSRDATHLEIVVEDSGHGLPETSNLFVPFFTTKPAGSGIGLVLSRQIAEAHGGSLNLENRSDARGCRAILRLPL